MLYSDKRYDISDQILRTISRSNNRKKLDSKKDKREAENENLIDESITETVNNNEPKDEKNQKSKLVNDPNKKLTVKELLELSKQKNSNKTKVKD